MKLVVLGLGSNKSFNGMSSLEILGKACHEIKELLQKTVFSSVYKTKAMYVTDQNDFYNMTLLGYVSDVKSPFELLKDINMIEAKYGRNRGNEIRFGPRSLDIDIESFGDDVINTKNLIIPHPRLKERAFVLIPALEIFTKIADKEKRDILNKYLLNLSESEKTLEIVASADEILNL